MFLVNSRYRHFSATSFRSKREALHVQEAHLLPKLRCHFAEFLNLGFSQAPWDSLPAYLCRFAVRSPHDLARGFSWQHGINHFMDRSPRRHISALRKRICLSPQPTCLNRLFQQTDDLPSCVPPSLKRSCGGTGIFTCFPSATPFGLALGID